VVLDFYEEPWVFGFNNKSKQFQIWFQFHTKWEPGIPVVGPVPNKKPR
jgi:hypothetical protein